MKSVQKIIGRFDIKIRDKHGRLKKELVAYNGITNAGKDLLLDVMFHAESPITPWFMGIINALPTAPILADTDTMPSHPGWAETDIYSEATRPEWVEDPASNQQITNPAKTIFTIDEAGTVAGFFLTSDNTKLGASEELWSTALFAEGDQVVVSSDTIEVTYTLSAAGA